MRDKGKQLEQGFIMTVEEFNKNNGSDRIELIDDTEEARAKFGETSARSSSS